MKKGQKSRARVVNAYQHHFVCYECRVSKPFKQLAKYLGRGIKVCKVCFPMLEREQKFTSLLKGSKK